MRLDGAATQLRAGVSSRFSGEVLMPFAVRQPGRVDEDDESSDGYAEAT